MAIHTDPRPINDAAFAAVLAVPPDLCCADWADRNFVLSAESSNTSGQWTTTVVQRAILNSMGNDSIEKVVFYKPARFGGTKLLIAAHAYFTVHKRRNVGFWQPTQNDIATFTKTEIDTAIRDCEPWSALLIDKRTNSDKNNLSTKMFMGSSAHYRGGHSANNFRRLTLDVAILDELDGFEVDKKEGDPSGLAWGRVKNAVHKKLIEISTPTVKNDSLIESAAIAADDMMVYQVECPQCGEHGPLIWGGKDSEFGFKWDGRDASTVQHYGACCATGWKNSELNQAVENGFWLGAKGLKTYDGLKWFRHGERCKPPRSISWHCWQGYSPFTSWEQIVQEFFDALGNADKLKTFVNTTLAETWSDEATMTVTPDLVGSILPTTDAEQLAQIRAVTAGIDTQSDRLEISYFGHATDRSVYLLGHSIHKGDTGEHGVYNDLMAEVSEFRFDNGQHKIPVVLACIDTQGSETEMVHAFLDAARRQRSGCTYLGINGVGKMYHRIADKVSTSAVDGGGKKEFYSIGVNTLKADVYELIRRFEQPERAFRIIADAFLPPDYADQLTAERMISKRQDGKTRLVFECGEGVRNEALDCAGYALAAKAYAQKHGHRQLKALFEGL
jgi:phage terminase large subunit GpA-like protein